MAKTIENIVEQLQQKNEELKGSSSLGATTLLSFPMYNDSARMMMFSSHILQRVVLNESEFPKVFTNFENILGNHSSYNQRASSNYHVIDVIEKFPDIETGKDIQTKLYLVYDVDNNVYDILERNDVEDLTEKYGFQYDNSGLNRFGKGDRIPKGTPLCRPTSYDEYGNYGYGKNVKFMYQINQDTIEDAIEISESLSKMMESTEVEEVKVPVNDNDILANWYGVGDEYKSFPDIGEPTKDKILCVKKRINHKQILFDLKASNVKKILGPDDPFYIEGVITDIDIFFNKTYEELNRGAFNQQLNAYIDMIYAFYNRVKEATQKIIDSGATCSDTFLYWNKRVKELTDPNYSNKDDLGNEFSNIVMYFKVKRTVGVGIGQKLTGRHGNKGVVSRIVPDHLMPHLENGEIVHIIFNTLGVFNRLNIFQLYEQSINFITERIVERWIKEDCSIKDMESDLFKVIRIFNEEEADKMESAYKDTCKTKANKDEYFDIIKKHGIFIHIKSYWHGKNVYDSVCECYDQFPWIKPYKVYFYEETSKRWVKMMNDQIVGSMYIMKLKQSSKKNLSTCSNAPINNLGLPEKTDSAKKHRTLYPKTPIRSGLQETINNMISIDPELSARLHMYYRSSPVARRQLGLEIVNNYGVGKPIEPIMTDKMTNRNVEILSAYLKVMGLKLVFDEDSMYLPTNEEGLNDSHGYYHRFNGKHYFVTPKEMLREVAEYKVRQKMEDEELGYIYIGTDGSHKEQVINELVECLELEILEDGPREFFLREGDSFK